MTHDPTYVVKTEQFEDFIDELRQRIQADVYVVHARFEDLTAFKPVNHPRIINQAIQEHSMTVSIADLDAKLALHDALASGEGSPLIALFDPELKPLGTHPRTPQAELHRSVRIDVNNAPLVKVHRTYFQPVEAEINVSCILTGDREDRYSVWLWGSKEIRSSAVNSASYGGVFTGGQLQQHGSEKAPEWVLPLVVDAYHEINHMRKLYA